MQDYFKTTVHLMHFYETTLFTLLLRTTFLYSDPARSKVCANCPSVQVRQQRDGNTLQHIPILTCFADVLKPHPGQFSLLLKERDVRLSLIFQVVRQLVVTTQCQSFTLHLLPESSEPDIFEDQAPHFYVADIIREVILFILVCGLMVH